MSIFLITGLGSGVDTWWQCNDITNIQWNKLLYTGHLVENKWLERLRSPFCLKTFPVWCQYAVFSQCGRCPNRGQKNVGNDFLQFAIKYIPRQQMNSAVVAVQIMWSACPSRSFLHKQQANVRVISLLIHTSLKGLTTNYEKSTSFWIFLFSRLSFSVELGIKDAVLGC